MAEVWFYHLTESTLEEALPNLLERSLARGWRVVVQCGSDERRNMLDSHLWTFREDSFLAHGSDGEAHAEHQPIILSIAPDANPNAAQARFLVDNAQPGDLASYERVIFLFDGHDEAQLAGARAQWKALKGGGHEVTYWQQSADRRWEKKA